MFEAEFCEPTEKAGQERELQEVLQQACEQTGKPLDVLEPAFGMVYPRYRAKRLAKEFPHSPFQIRDR